MTATVRLCHSERSEESRVSDCLSAQVYPRGILRVGVLPANLDCQDASATVKHCLGFFRRCAPQNDKRRSRVKTGAHPPPPLDSCLRIRCGAGFAGMTCGARLFGPGLENTAGAVREPPLHYVNPLAGGPVSRLDRLCRRACTTTPPDNEHRRTYACHHQQEHEEQPHREPAALVRRRRRRGLWP